MKTENQRLYVVYDRVELTMEIFTTQIDAALYAGVSVDTVQRNVTSGVIYIGKRYTIGLAIGINKNQNRVAQGKRQSKRMIELKKLIPQANYGYTEE